MFPKKLLALAFALSLTIFACVEPYELAIPQTRRILTVDGVLTDSPLADQYVRIQESVPYNNGVLYQLVGNASVTVVENDNVSFSFPQISKGVFRKPDALKIKEKTKYRLEITINNENGTENYVSEIEEFSAAIPINRAYAQLETEGIQTAVGTAPAQYVYVDTKDQPGKGNNYVWSWKLYERQSVCVTCENGRYFIDRRTGIGACRDESATLPEAVTYDYICDGDCWEIFQNNDINAMSDTYVDGQPIIGRLVGKIPLYQPRGALMEIKQLSVSPGAFRYLKLLTEQSQNTGSLADTPPAALIGNVKNVTNPTETVAGYFMVASEDTHLLWLDRNEAIERGLKFRGLLGRNINLEPSSTPDRPPLAPCLKSNSRTPEKPRGWVD